MASSSNQHLFFLLLALLLPIAIKGDDFITQKCGENFTDNAILQGNINSVLLDLVANSTSAYGFANSSNGTGADTVYGISECREGVNAQACSACVSEAALKSHTSCPNSADLSVWQHSCYLRYSNIYLCEVRRNHCIHDRYRRAKQSQGICNVQKTYRRDYAKDSCGHF